MAPRRLVFIVAVVAIVVIGHDLALLSAQLSEASGQVTYLPVISAGWPTPVPGVTATPILYPPFAVFASIQDVSPIEYERETVFVQFNDAHGRGISGATVHSDWYLATGTESCDGALTNDYGVSQCTQTVGKAGIVIPIIVTVTYEGQSYQGQTSVIPSGTPPTPAPIQ